VNARYLTPAQLDERYELACSLVVSAGFACDIDWANALKNVVPDKRYVMRETAWVIVNSGFRYAVARKLWPGLCDATGNFDPSLMVFDAPKCRRQCLRVLNYPKKIDAILEVARILLSEGHESIVLDANDPPKLCRLPFIGPTTCWHLAKVLGADSVKPDVHLKRAAAAAGFDNPLELCRSLQRSGDVYRERLTVIDSVLWRYGEQLQSQGWPDWDLLFGDVMPSTTTVRGQCEFPGFEGGAK
jgi:hypothetical protein